MVKAVPKFKVAEINSFTTSAIIKLYNANILSKNMLKILSCKVIYKLLCFTVALY